MQRLQAYKFELQPTGEQTRDLRRFAGACRFVFNKALALQQARRSAGDKHLSAFALNNLLPAWKRDTDTTWLQEIHSQVLQQALKDLDRAYQNFFAGRAAFPRFKKKGQHDSFRYPQGVKLEQHNNRIFLPKLGWVRYRNSREVLGTIKNVTVRCRAGKWFVALQTEREVPQAYPAGGEVGIDLGIARFATLNDGTYQLPLSSFKQHEAALRRAQQALSRKTKFSNNWRKAKAKVQKLHHRIANVRNDYLHKFTTHISQNHAIVYVEDLQVKNMSRSAAGTLEAPGRNVRAKAGLNKAILDQGWAEFRRQLEYKMSWRGGHLVAVPPAYTSQNCPACGGVSKENRKTQAEFACVHCGFAENADVVGAINILERGRRLLACGEVAQSGTSMKQEPTEATQRLAA